MGEKEKNSFVLQKDDKGLCRGRKWGEGSISSLVSQERGTEHPIKNRYFVNIPPMETANAKHQYREDSHLQ